MITFVAFKPKKPYDSEAQEFEGALSVLAHNMEHPTRIGVSLSIAGCERTFSRMRPYRAEIGRSMARAVKTYVNEKAGKLVAIP